MWIVVQLYRDMLQVNSDVPRMTHSLVMIDSQDQSIFEGKCSATVRAEYF